MSANGRYCCKSLFPLMMKNSAGCRHDFRVKMWGTSSPDDKLTADLGNVIETTQIGGRRSNRLTAGKLSPGNFGLLQQYPPKSGHPIHAAICLLRAKTGLMHGSKDGFAHGRVIRVAVMPNGMSAVARRVRRHGAPKSLSCESYPNPAATRAVQGLI